MRTIFTVGVAVIAITAPTVGYTQDDPANCGLTQHQETIERIRYLTPEVAQPNICQSEVQTNRCLDGELTGWSGTFQFNHCTQRNAGEARLLQISQLSYQGAFRLSPSKFGDSSRATISQSDGIITYNSNNHSLFITGHPYEQQIAEFQIPAIVNSTNLEELNVGDSVIQPFTKILGTSKLDTGDYTHLKISGMELIDSSLVVNYMAKRDYNGTHDNTTFVVRTASDLSQSEIAGPYKLEGRLHSGGWISKIPTEWQPSLGGSYIFGNAGSDLVWYRSLGPTAFSFFPEDTLLAAHDSQTLIDTNTLLDFSFQDIMRDDSVNKDVPDQSVLLNENRLNDLWTVTTGASFGFIVPGTRTYATFGHSSGHDSGIDYGIVQDNGQKCYGPCAYETADKYGYYWLWDVNDLLKVKNGEKDAHEIRPYQYGKFNTPFGSDISGGTFDPENRTLYLAIAKGDTGYHYDKPPVFVTYQIEDFSEYIPVGCDDLAHGESYSRVRYAADFVDSGAACMSETQHNMCNDGDMQGWTGSYQFESCEELSPIRVDLPLVNMNALDYAGAFRISGANFGSDSKHNANYSNGVITLNPDRNSLFLVGHSQVDAIGEFAIPEISPDLTGDDLPMVDTSIQNFETFYGTDRVDTGIEGFFRIMGMHYIDGALMVNYINWYDALNNETDTTMLIKDASQLATSDIVAPFQLAGAAHAAGYISPVPSEWQDWLGGTIMNGAPKASIIGRLSVGPTAFVMDPASQLLTNQGGELNTNRLLDFALTNILYDQDKYPDYPGYEPVLYNDDLQNDLWTMLSGTSYGFIVPGTTTYMTIGVSGGHDSGLGYKATQIDGNQCAGPCSYDPNDNYPYYWLWNMNDLLEVQAGNKEAHEIRPYEYGVLPLPDHIKDLTGAQGVGGGTFDEVNGRLYLSFPQAGQVGRYDRPPLIVAFDVNAANGQL